MNTLLQAAGNICAKTWNNLKIEVNELLKMYLSQVLLLFLLSRKRAKANKRSCKLRNARTWSA